MARGAAALRRRALLAALCAALWGCEAVQLLGGGAAADDPAGSYLDCSWTYFDFLGYIHGRPPPDFPCAQTPDFSRENQRKTIACIGDSITEGYLVQSNESYPAVLHRLLGGRFNVVNLGVGGAAAQATREPTNHSYWRLPHWRAALEAEVDVAIVQLGTNDARTGLWDEARFRRDYAEMLRQLRERHPRAAIIASVPPPVGPNSKIDLELVKSGLAQAVRDARREVGERLAPIDMQREFTEAGRAIRAARPRGAARMAHPPERLMYWDNVHPTAAGHRVMAEAAARAVESALGLPRGGA